MADFPSTHPNLQTSLTDNVDYVEAVHVNTPNNELNAVITHLIRSLPLGHYSNTETLSANKTFTDSDKVIQYLDPGGADRGLILPAEGGTNHWYIIVNTADADEDLLVVDDSDAKIIYIGQGEMGIVFCDGTTWDGGVGVELLDEDDLSSDDPAKPASQQSIKAFVENLTWMTPESHIIDADGTLADITTKFNTLLASLETIGFLESS